MPRPRAQTFSLTYGCEAVCLLRRGPRAFLAPIKTSSRDPLALHASVVASFGSALPAHAFVTELTEEEVDLRRAWRMGTVGEALQGTASRDVLAWATKKAERRR
jgi:hypothetical protein